MGSSPEMGGRNSDFKARYESGIINPGHIMVDQFDNAFSDRPHATVVNRDQRFDCIILNKN
jgi:hypothetical protein